MHALFDGGASPLALPARPGDLAPHYDLTVAAASGGPSEFDRRLAEAADGYGLSSAWIALEVAATAADLLASGGLHVGLHLARGTDWRGEGALARLALAVQDAGGRSINLPARAGAFTDRATLHHELGRQGLGALPAVVVRPWAPPRSLDARQRWELRLDEPGARLEVVPAGRGEPIPVPRPTAENVQSALAQARARHPGEALVLRPEVRPPWLTCDDGECRPAHWRVLSLLGEATVFWWQPGTYREVTPAEIEAHSLRPVFRYAQRLGELSGLEWFSADLLLCPHPWPGAFTVPDVAGLDLPLLASELDDGWQTELLPDAFVRRAARRVAELAWGVRRRGEPSLLRAG